MVIGKLLGVFIIVCIGYLANKAGWIPVSASRYLAKIVINIAAPCVVVGTLSEQELSGGSLKIILLAVGISIAQHAFCLPVGILANKLMKVPQAHRGIYKNFLLFSNNGFMGFPVALALFGHQGMFYLVLSNCVMVFILFTLGSANLRNRGEEKLSFRRKLKIVLKDVLDVPIIALLVGLALLFLQVHLPVELKDVLSSIGSMMAPLSMIVIGLQLTASKPAQVLTNHRLIVITILRLLFLPGVFFLATIPFPMDPLLRCVLTLNLMLPCATIPVAMAEEHGQDARLAAEGTFLTTLFSMITIPIFGFLLSFVG